MLKLVGGLLAAIALICSGIFLAAGPLQNFLPWGTSANQQVRSHEIVASVTQEKQVVLLSLGIQGIEERTAAKERFFGLFEVPGTGRSKFVKYDFTAKLGLNGADVTIEQTAPSEYLITLPEFIFIGHDNVSFSLAAEDNGLLSWVTPAADDFEIATEILNNEGKDKYLATYEEDLKAQAASFYRQIISGVDPAVTVNFAFATEQKDSEG